MNPARLRAYGQLLVVSIIWGIAGSVIKYTQQGIETLPFLIYRFGLSAIFGIFFFLFVKEKLFRGMAASIELFIYAILTSSVSLGLLFLGLERTTVVESELIGATNPMVASIFGVWMLREHVTKKESLGILIAFAGTVFVVFEPLLNGNLKEIHLLGNALILAYVVVASFTSILAKRLLRKGYSAMMLTNFGFLIGFLSVVAFYIYQTGSLLPIDTILTLEPKYHAGVAFMAFISGTLAYFLWAEAQKTIEVGETSVFSYLLPVFGIPVAVLWLGEKLTVPSIIGAVIIAIGVFIAEAKRKRN